MGIPIPPIFVFQGQDNIWELIDGLQRLSTVFQFMGILKGDRAVALGPLILEGTNYLPDLDGKRWEDSAPDALDGIGAALQIQIKRSRLRVEILQPESDATAKFELFQRLNTGGASLSEQEIRNCVAVMIDGTFYEWLLQLSQSEAFVRTTKQTEVALEAQAGLELSLRLISFAHRPYERKLDVHEYLDKALIELATDVELDRVQIGADFVDCFRILDRALGEFAFTRWDGNAFRGKFLISVFEVIALGTYQNVDAIKAMDDLAANAFITERVKALWQNEVFRINSSGGVRGTTRLVNLLPIARDFMRPV